MFFFLKKTFKQQTIRNKYYYGRYWRIRIFSPICDLDDLSIRSQPCTINGATVVIL